MATADAVFQARGLAKVYRVGEVEVHALRGVDLDAGSRRARRPARPLRQRQVDAAQHPRRARRAHRAARCGSATTTSSAGDEAALTRYRREHVGFVFQFYNLIPSLTARENVALVTEIADAPDGPRRGARARRPRGPHRPLPRAALRRRAAARRDRARDREAARRAALRRAHRRARRRDRQARARGDRAHRTASSARRPRSSRTTRRSRGMADRVVRMRSGRIVEIAPQRSGASRPTSSTGEGALAAKRLRDLGTCAARWWRSRSSSRAASPSS